MELGFFDKCEICINCISKYAHNKQDNTIIYIYIYIYIYHGGNTNFAIFASDRDNAA